MAIARGGRCSIVARAGMFVVAIVAAMLALAGPARAQAVDVALDDAQVVLSGRLLVPEGETVGSAVIFDGPAIVEGTVAESLVVFNGRVLITGTVQRDVVVFNGTVVVRDGAEVGGNLVTQETPVVEPGAKIGGEQRSVSTSGAEFGELGFASRLAWWLAYSISTLVLGLLLLLAAPRLEVGVSAALRERLWPSIGIGLAAFLLLPIVALVLVATLIALPLGAFLLLGIALIYTAGYVVGTLAIGRRIVREPKPRYVAFLAGWGIARLLALIPVVGGIVWMLVTIVGLGVILVALRRRPDATQLAQPDTSGSGPPPPYPIPAS